MHTLLNNSSIACKEGYGRNNFIPWCCMQEYQEACHLISCTHTQIHSHVLYRRSHSFSVLSWLPVTYTTPATMAMPSCTPDNRPLWLLQGTLHTILYCRDQSEFAMDSNTKYVHTNVMLSGAPHVCMHVVHNYHFSINTHYTYVA